MPHEPKHSYGAGTLPTPELNPLLNPVLGQHMGRWAEVYFSSPPEKREQAVLELLRELEMENSTQSGAVASTPSPVQKRARDVETVPALQTAEIPPTTARCQNCGRINPATHRFCGMCGKPVAEQSASSDLHVSDLHVADLHVADLHVADADLHDEDSHVIPPAEPFYERTQGTQTLPLFQSVSGIDYREDDRRVLSNDHGGAHDPEIFAYAAAPRSYRLYVGLVLVSMLLGLAYLAWRTTETTQSTHVEPQSPPPVATQPSVPAPSPGTPTTEVPNQTTPSTQPETAASQTAPSQAEKERAKRAVSMSTSKAARAKARVARPPAPVAGKSPETTPRNMTGTKPGGGTEELAMALSYLDGTGGQERNHSEAAKWLWKSVAKQNADATLVLSDLYLKGDGVGKNCDQARILLDAAARKGMKQAGDRLRHLQAFGCQ